MISMQIRDAVEADLPTILEVFDDVGRDSHCLAQREALR
jgi:hypothetical protein